MRPTTHQQLVDSIDRAAHEATYSWTEWVGRQEHVKVVDVDQIRTDTLHVVTRAGTSRTDAHRLAGALAAEILRAVDEGEPLAYQAVTVGHDDGSCRVDVNAH